MAVILKLDQIMAKRGISLNDLAEQVGISNVNLSRIKTGKIKAIRFSTLNELCRVLECKPGDILDFISNEEAARLGIHTHLDEDDS